MFAYLVYHNNISCVDVDVCASVSVLIISILLITDNYIDYINYRYGHGLRGRVFGVI